jgi:uncharacterized cofD-like protein
LRVRTQVLPMSETPTDLMAFYPEGRCRLGELSVDEMPIMPKSLLLAPLVKSIEPCVEAINKADLIILGPGSFLTSIIPPLLVRDISNAIANRKGHCVFIENVGLENSPAAKLTLDEKLHWIEENIGCLPIDSVICQEPNVVSKKINVICRDLAHHQQAHHHDKKKLINALEACVSGLQANIKTEEIKTVKQKLA